MNDAWTCRACGAALTRAEAIEAVIYGPEAANCTEPDEALAIPTEEK